MGRLMFGMPGPAAPSTCRALIAEESGRLWVGTDTNLVALNPIPVVTDEVSPIRLNFLLASKRGGYWRLANGRIQKCNGDRVERDLGAVSVDQHAADCGGVRGPGRQPGGRHLRRRGLLV